MAAAVAAAAAVHAVGATDGVVVAAIGGNRRLVHLDLLLLFLELLLLGLYKRGLVLTRGNLKAIDMYSM